MALGLGSALLMAAPAWGQGAAAAATALPAPTPSVEGTLWTIVQARIEPVLAPRGTRLQFDVARARVDGHTGCRPFSAPYTLQDGRLQLGPLELGPLEARCNSLGREQDDRILSGLEGAVSARVRDDGLLELRDPEGRGTLRARLPEKD